MLKESIKDSIRQHGPMPLADYMARCLQHYYTSRDPLGKNGDFTTAPEVSQLFGEMVAAWLGAAWRAMGSPERTLLVELGPGRGTLMADILRTLKSALPECYASLEVHLVEVSPFLKKKQEEALKGMRVTWHEEFAAFPDLPILLIANEFFDALPIRQFYRTNNGWEEKAVGLEGESLVWTYLSPRRMPGSGLPDAGIRRHDSIVETSPASLSILSALAEHIATHSGAALIVDYGYTEGHGDTFQALKDHQYADPLANPGEADLTAHVDFAALKAAAEEAGAKAYVTTQGAFLQQMGIALRAEILCRSAEPRQQEQLLSGLTRLTAPDAMGTLFKCMAVVHEDSSQPYGFPPC